MLKTEPKAMCISHDIAKYVPETNRPTTLVYMPCMPNIRLVYKDDVYTIYATYMGISLNHVSRSTVHILDKYH